MGSNKGAMHQACIVVDEEVQDNLTSKSQASRLIDSIKLVDVCDLFDQTEKWREGPSSKESYNGHAVGFVGELWPIWAAITHHGTLQEYVHIKSR